MPCTRRVIDARERLSHSPPPLLVAVLVVLTLGLAWDSLGAVSAALACWADGPELSAAAQAKDSSAWALVRLASSKSSVKGEPCRTWFDGTIIDEFGTDTGMTTSFAVEVCSGDDFVSRASTSPSLEVGASYLLFLTNGPAGPELLHGAMSAFVLLPEDAALGPHCWVARMTGPGGSADVIEMTVEQVVQEAESAASEKGLGRNWAGREGR